MKKALAYTAAAILLGFTIIMLPKMIQTYPSTEQTASNDLRSPPTPAFSVGLEPKPFLLLSQPSSFLPTTAIIVSGLIVGITTYAAFKKRKS